MWNSILSVDDSKSKYPSTLKNVEDAVCILQYQIVIHDFILYKQERLSNSYTYLLKVLLNGKIMSTKNLFKINLWLIIRKLFISFIYLSNTV